MADLNSLEKVIVLKDEGASYGVDASPVGADAILAYDISFEPDIQVVEMQGMDTYPELQPHKIGRRKAKLSFTVDISGPGATLMTSGADGPKWFRAARWCGWQQTLTAGVSQTLKPRQSLRATESGTIKFYVDGIRHTMTGCRGQVSFSMDEVGLVAKAKFVMIGIYNDPAAAAFPGSLAFEAVEPPPWMEGTNSIGGFAADIEKFNFEPATKMDEKRSFQAAGGYKRFSPKQWNPKLSFSADDELPGTKNWLAEWKAGASHAITLSWNTAVAGNGIAFAFPVVRYSGAKPSGDLTAMMEMEGIPYRDKVGAAPFCTITLT